MTTEQTADPMADVFQTERQTCDQPAHGDEPFAKRQVVYANIDGRELSGTLYQPVQPPNGGGPAMVWCHGGGWQGGDRGQFARHGAWLATLGFTSLCITYRLTGEAIWPACVQDALCGVRWMRAHAAELNVDVARVGIGGGSAGGHLAAMVATSGGAPRWPAAGGWDDQPSHVKAAVLLNPVLRLVPREGENLTRESRQNLLGGTVEEVPERYADASPINHVSADTAACLLLHGRDDKTVSCEQSVEFFDALIRNRVGAEIELYDGVGHGWFNRPPNFQVTLARLAAFLGRRL